MEPLAPQVDRIVKNDWDLHEAVKEMVDKAFDKAMEVVHRSLKEFFKEHKTLAMKKLGAEKFGADGEVVKVDKVEGSASRPERASPELNVSPGLNASPGMNHKFSPCIDLNFRGHVELGKGIGLSGSSQMGIGFGVGYMANGSGGGPCGSSCGHCSTIISMSLNQHGCGKEIKGGKKEIESEYHLYNTVDSAPIVFNESFERNHIFVYGKSLSSRLKMKPIQFEKDDVTNHHMDWIATIVNTRAINYSILKVNMLISYFMFGRIIAAIAISTTMATCLFCLELYKGLNEGHKVEDYRNTFSSIVRDMRNHTMSKHDRIVGQVVFTVIFTPTGDFLHVAQTIVILLSHYMILHVAIIIGIAEKFINVGTNAFNFDPGGDTSNVSFTFEIKVTGNIHLESKEFVKKRGNQKFSTKNKEDISGSTMIKTFMSGRDIFIPAWYDNVESEFDFHTGTQNAETNQSSVFKDSGIQDFEILHRDLLGLTDTNDAVCFDESPPTYQVDKEFGGAVNNWIVFLERKGWCDTSHATEDCLNSYLLTGRDPSTNMFPKNFTGMTSMERSFNTYFYNWNRVDVRYCDRVSFTSNNVEPVPKFHYKGAMVFNVVVQELLAKVIKNASNELLSGCSAGGLVAMQNWDKFRSLLSISTRVRCASDAAYFPHWKDALGGFSFAKNLPKSSTSKATKESDPQSVP